MSQIVFERMLWEEDVVDHATRVEDTRATIEAILNDLLPINAEADLPPICIGPHDNTVTEEIYELALTALRDLLDRVLGEPEITINLVVNIQLPVGTNILILETE